MKTQAIRFLMRATRYDEKDLAPLIGFTDWKYNVREPDLNIVLVRVNSAFEEAELTLDDVYEPHIDCGVDLLPMTEGLWLWEGIFVDEHWIGTLRPVLGDLLWAHLEDRINLDDERMIVKESRQEHLL